MSIRSPRNSSANWRSWLRGSLRRSSGRSTRSRSGVLVLGMVMGSALVRVYHLAKGRLAARPLHNPFQPAFGGLELGLAMAFQGLAALIKDNGILQIDFPLLEARNNALQ